MDEIITVVYKDGRRKCFSGICLFEFDDKGLKLVNTAGYTDLISKEYILKIRTSTYDDILKGELWLKSQWL